MGSADTFIELLRQIASFYLSGFVAPQVPGEAVGPGFSLSSLRGLGIGPARSWGGVTCRQMISSRISSGRGTPAADKSDFPSSLEECPKGAPQAALPDARSQFPEPRSQLPEPRSQLPAPCQLPEPRDPEARSQILVCRVGLSDRFVG
jgi:hypothetical protein